MKALDISGMHREWAGAGTSVDPRHYEARDIPSWARLPLCKADHAPGPSVPAKLGPTAAGLLVSSLKHPHKEKGYPMGSFATSANPFRPRSERRLRKILRGCLRHETAPGANGPGRAASNMFGTAPQCGSCFSRRRREGEIASNHFRPWWVGRPRRGERGRRSGRDLSGRPGRPSANSFYEGEKNLPRPDRHSCSIFTTKGWARPVPRRGAKP